MDIGIGDHLARSGSNLEGDKFIGGHSLAVSGRGIPVEDDKVVMEVAEPQVGWGRREDVVTF